jgi:hypothetical protein
MAHPVIEVAVFEAREPESFTAQQAALHDALGAFDGFVSAVPLRGIDEPSVFADLVVWHDLDAALAAAGAVGSRPDLAWFHDALGAIRLFTHVRPFDDPSEVLTASSAAPVVEIVAYRPADPEPQRAAHRLLHERHLPAAQGVVAHTGFVGDDGLVGDLIGWVDAAAHERTGATLMPVPELSPIFDPANDVVVFGLFGRSGA